MQKVDSLQLMIKSLEDFRKSREAADNDDLSDFISTFHKKVKEIRSQETEIKELRQRELQYKKNITEQEGILQIFKKTELNKDKTIVQLMDEVRKIREVKFRNEDLEGQLLKKEREAIEFREVISALKEDNQRYEMKSKTLLISLRDSQTKVKMVEDQMRKTCFDMEDLYSQYEEQGRIIKKQEEEQAQIIKKHRVELQAAKIETNNVEKRLQSVIDNFRTFGQQKRVELEAEIKEKKTLKYQIQMLNSELRSAKQESEEISQEIFVYQREFSQMKNRIKSLQYKVQCFETNRDFLKEVLAQLKIKVQKTDWKSLPFVLEENEQEDFKELRNVLANIFAAANTMKEELKNKQDRINEKEKIIQMQDCDIKRLNQRLTEKSDKLKQSQEKAKSDCLRIVELEQRIKSAKNKTPRESVGLQNNIPLSNQYFRRNK